MEEPEQKKRFEGFVRGLADAANVVGPAPFAADAEAYPERKRVGG
jgi:hypothetical protein